MMGQRVRDRVALAQKVDEGPQFGHRNAVLAAVLAQQPSLDELRPGDRGAIATGLHANHRLVRFAAHLAAFEPVVQRVLGHLKQPRRLGLGVHLPL